jgi:uncharacterized protein (TIGR00106 family)
MLAQLSVWPLDKPHMSEDVAEVASILDGCDVTYEVGPMGTLIEGDWAEVMSAVEACHRAVREKHARVLTSLTIDDDPNHPRSLAEAQAKADQAATAK